jgi:hypothetical protein
MNIDKLWNAYSENSFINYGEKKHNYMTKENFTKAIAEILSLPVEAKVSDEANGNPYEELFWQMLRYLEVHTKPEDILIRRDIEDGYKLWNKLHNTDMKPSWLSR